MTITKIDEWFQLAAQAMFASVALGEYRFYECEAGPGCAWPGRVAINPPNEVWFVEGPHQGCGADGP